MASAAGADGAELDEVVVTGFRASLTAALDAKREAAGAIDQIVAEDIAKFPDQNLSESIQRIPGVSISRDAGEGRQLTVRGLGPQYTRVRINGMEAIASVGVTDQDGGTNRTRSFDFNVFASELFRSITVRKTAAAELDEGSLGATVDLRSSRPFDFNGLTFATSAQASYNDLAGHTDPRFAMLLSNTFADGKFGALISAAYSKRNVIEEGASTVRWQNSISTDTQVTASPLFSSAAGTGYSVDQLSRAFRPRLPRYDFYENSQKRLGITASLQFKPADSTELSFDVLYSKYDAERNESFLEAPSFSGSTTNPVLAVNNMTVTSAAIDGTNTLVYGQFNNVGIRTEQRHDEMTTDFRQFTLEGKHEFNDSFSMHAVLGRAKSEFDNPIQTTLTWDGSVAQGYTYDFRGNSKVPYISYGSTDVTNPAVWKLSSIRLRPQGVNNQFDNALVDMKWQMSDAISWLGGVQYKKYNFDTFERRRSNGTTANQEATVPASAAAVPTAAYANLVSIGNLGAPAGSQLSWVAANLDAAAQAMGFYDPALYPLGAQPILANNFSVEEKDTSAFAQMNFKFPVHDMNIRGDIGLRYVKTKQASAGYTFASGAALANSADVSYSDVLPALNAVLDTGNDFLVRFSAAKVMARPGLGSLNPGAVVSVSGNNFTVTAGNPRLKPTRAKSYDLGFEWYPTKGMLMGLTLFYKSIDTFAQTVRSTGTFNANTQGLPDSVAVAACGATVGCSPSSPNWQFSQPANTPGGPLKGVEVNLQVPFTFLPSFWRSFGALFTYTYVDSNIAYVNTSGATIATSSLLELSKDAVNATLYFDNGKFSARVSAAYRSDFLQTVPGRNGVTYAANTTVPGAVVGATVPYGNDVEGTNGSTTIDFSSSWAFNDHFSVSLEGLNLTNTPNYQWIDSAANRLSFYHKSGRQIMVGGRYKF